METQVARQGNGEGVRERLARYLAHGMRSQAEVAAALGLSPATLSQWRRGAYTGDNEAVERKVAAYLDLEERRVREPARGFVLTSVAREVLTACEFAHEHLVTAVINGEAGMGKTTALLEYCRRHPEAIYIRCNPAFRTPKALLEAVLVALGRSPRGLNALNRLVDEAVDALAGTQRLVILDEAQFMTRDTLEVARTLHDQAGVPLVLAGNYDLYNRMMGKASALWAQVFSRVGIHREVRRSATLEDVRAMVGGVSEEVARYLWERTREPGGLRRMEMVWRMGRRIAEREGAEVTVRHLDLGVSLLMGGGAA